MSDSKDLRHPNGEPLMVFRPQRLSEQPTITATDPDVQAPAWRIPERHQQRLAQARALNRPSSAPVNEKQGGQSHG